MKDTLILFYAVLRKLIISQTFENRLPQATGFCFHHIFYCAYQTGTDPYGIPTFILGWKWILSIGHSVDPLKYLTTDSQTDMPFVYKMPVAILAQHDARHASGLWNIAADHIVGVFHILALDPISCALVKVIFAVLPFGNDPFQLLLLRKLVEGNPVFPDIPGNSKPI